MKTEKSLHIHYYGPLREAAGLSEETVRSSAATAAELYDEIGRQHGIRLDLSVLRVARNDRIVPWTSEVADGDTVVFLPPFAGG